MFHIARLYCKELGPETMEEVEEFMLIQGVINDYNRNITMPAYMSKTKEDLVKAMTSGMKYQKCKTQYFVEKLEAGKWILGDKLSYLDFFLSELLEKLTVMEDELNINFIGPENSKIFKDYVERFNALEKVKEFRESKRSIDRPFNNTPKAVWG